MKWISVKDRVPDKTSQDKSKEVIAYITSPADLGVVSENYNRGMKEVKGF